MPDADVIVIGSGPAGVHAAETLIERGATVLMLDGGRTGPRMDDVPTANFLDVRRSDPEQWEWFLGKDLSAIGLDGLTGGLGGGQISGNRHYVSELAPGELPLETQNGIVVQTLAQGGLGAAWGAACAILPPDELSAMGLPAAQMERCYEIVGKRIGLSGPGDRPWIQPALPLDLHGTNVKHYAEKHSKKLRDRNIVGAEPLSAILTEDLHGRKASSLADMEYWADPGRSVYRPQYTLETLKASPNFSYHSGVIVRTISGDPGAMEVTCDTIGKDLKETFNAKKIVLAGNAANTARILLASLGMTGIDIPFIGKPHVFSACIDPHALGKTGPKKRISLCQYTLTDMEERDGLPRAFAQLYGYRSMLLFRLLQSIPLPMPEAISVASVLSPALVIADIRFPATLENAATLRLESTKNGNPITIRFPNPSNAEQNARNIAWKSIRQALRTVHLLPVKNIVLPEGSTSHYAGTVPMGEKGSSPLSSDTNGQCNELPGAWIADASTFRSLSPKPHTLTIMANACRVAEYALR